METGRQCNKPFGVLLQHVFVYTGLVVESFQLGNGDKLAKITIPLHVFCKQNKMGKPFTVPGGFMFQASRGHIAFTPDHGFDPGLFCHFVEFNRTEHSTMIGYGNSIHSKFSNTLKKRVKSYCPVKQAVLSMNMQVNKIGRHNFFY